MGQVVYADLLFFINFSMDFLCFYLTAKLLHHRLKKSRILAGAALGALYSVAAVFGESVGAWALAADIGVCVLMSGVVFGERGQSLGRFLRYPAVYAAVSMLTGGIMTSLFHALNRLSLPLDEIAVEDDITVWLFAALASLSGAMALYSGRLWHRESRKQISELEIVYRGRALRLRALVDSGNLLQDPIGGKCVVVVDAAAARPLLGEELFALIKANDPGGCVTLSGAPTGMRLIPAGSATGRGLLCGFAPERMTVSPERGAAYEVDALFAPTPDLAGTLGDCQALLPLTLWNG